MHCERKPLPCGVCSLIARETSEASMTSTIAMRPFVSHAGARQRHRANLHSHGVRCEAVADLVHIAFVHGRVVLAQDRLAMSARENAGG